MSSTTGTTRTSIVVANSCETPFPSVATLNVATSTDRRILGIATAESLVTGGDRIGVVVTVVPVMAVTRILRAVVKDRACCPCSPATVLRVTVVAALSAQPSASPRFAL